MSSSIPTTHTTQTEKEALPKMRIDGHPNNDSFNFYRKYTGTYYFGKNYSGTVYRAAPFYEARITQS